MKVVLTCGHPYSGLQQLHQAMLRAGLKSAKVSGREMFSPEDIQNKICEAMEVDSSFTLNLDQLEPGKVWQWLSTDLFIANLDQEAWGWTDPKTIYLLNYWRDLDPQTRFVLVYASPTYALAQLLREEEASPVLVEGLCSSWARVNAELLSFYNRNPDRSILVNVEALSLPMEANRLLSVSRDRLGINFCSQADWCIDLPLNDAVFSLFASSLLQERTAVQELYQELESVADIISDFSEPPKEQVAQAFVQYRYLASRHDEALTQSTQLNAQVTELQSQLRQIKLETASEKQKPDQSSQLTALEKENELLLLQLHQVQEDLEHYFLKYMEITQGQVQPVEQVVVDFHQPVDGVNWYDAEADGRWAGPEKISTIRIPHLNPGQYQLELDVVDAMAPEILENMSLSLNGQPIFLQRQVDGDSLFSALFKKKRRYPVLLQAIFTVSAAQANKPGVLAFQFPKLIVPTTQSTDDHRHLAIRVRKLQIVSLRKQEIVGVDLRQAIQGQNWYDAEVDGSWAGPEKSSTLKLPKVKPGRYQIELEVVDAMMPEILKGTKFSLNGIPLNFVDTKPLPLLLRLIGKKKKFPIILTACADIGLAQCNTGLDLGFQFPNVISPASRGSQDTRYLALRLKTVKLKPLA
jgi:hypothetical protein